MNSSQNFTTPILDGYRIAEYKGLVTARNVRAMNIVRDIFTSFRDFFGGRSGSFERVMGDMENEVLATMALIMAYGVGTAVVVVETSRGKSSV